MFKVCGAPQCERRNFHQRRRRRHHRAAVIGVVAIAAAPRTNAIYLRNPRGTVVVVVVGVVRVDGRATSRAAA